jgi:hypothetical protein
VTILIKREYGDKKQLRDILAALIMQGMAIGGRRDA